MGYRSRIYTAVFSFMAGSHTTDAGIGSLVVVSPELFSRLLLCLLNRFEDMWPQLLATNSAVVALDIGVLFGLARLDVFQPNMVFFSPFHQLATDIFWAIVDLNFLRLTAPFNDVIQAAHAPLCR